MGIRDESPASIVVLMNGRDDDAVTAFVQHTPSARSVDASFGEASACAAINELDPAPPLIIVAAGRAALVIPAVARSQRSMHRLVLEYLLLDPELPPVTETWPDARVTVVCDVDSEESLHARLRGWDVLRWEDLAEWGAGY